MSPYASLFALAKLLLSEDDPDRTAETLFRRVIEITGATRGFIVVAGRSGSLEQRCDLGFDRAGISDHERRFSRTLVGQAVARRELVAATLPFDAPPDVGSLADRPPCSILVAPLALREQVLGAIYVEREGPQAFGDEHRRFLLELGEAAAGFLARAAERSALRERMASLEHDLFARHDFGGIVTRDPRMLATLKLVAQVADSAATVLIGGESGTGKELIARALHVNSARRKRPFVVLHCAALPAALLESELFGHLRGAFTGADRDRQGRLAQADGGTLFLDEVGEIAPEVQPKLLRFLQFGELQRVGSDRIEKVDVRVVAATHRRLPELIEQGRFRQDLYFRLKVVEIALPPLRERAVDIPLLAAGFLRERWRRPGEPRLTPRALQLLTGYPFPGNVRELEHLMERAALIAPSAEIDLDALPPEIQAASRPSGRPVFTRYDAEELDETRAAAVAALEREFLAELLRRSEGNVSLASRTSGIHRSYLQRMLARNGLG